jgi:hypothetical protein
MGVGRGADLSLTRIHPLWEKILSQNLQAVADQGGNLEGSFPYKGGAYRRVYCKWNRGTERGEEWMSSSNFGYSRRLGQFESCRSLGKWHIPGASSNFHNKQELDAHKSPQCDRSKPTDSDVIFLHSPSRMPTKPLTEAHRL